MISLVVATRNPHKVAEIQSILGPGFLCLPLTAFPEAPRLVEDGATFAENAARKALQLASWLSGREFSPEEGSGRATSQVSRWVLADDSGLEVDALGGAPGVLSARFAADEPGAGTNTNATDAANNRKLLRLLREVPWEKRTARFHCVLALVEAGPQPAAGIPQLFEGICEGRVDVSARGQGGFGYDPLFVPDGFATSFAELGEEVKNHLSHRFKALLQLKQWLAASSDGQ